MFGMILRKV